MAFISIEVQMMQFVMLITTNTFSLGFITLQITLRVILLIGSELSALITFFVYLH